MKRIFKAISRAYKNPALLKKYCKRYISIARMCATNVLVLAIKNRLYKRDIWLISEKGTEARDNGFYFFKYIKEVHPEINAYFVITGDSPDLEKVSKYNSTVILNSFSHYAYSLTAKVSASSQPFGALPDPADRLYHLTKRLGRKDQVVIHLKHGITKDELPHSLDYSNTRFDLLCCVSDIERDFMQKIHGYPDEKIKTLGFCRFDALLTPHEVEKQILIMPTHRIWLHAANTDKKAGTIEKELFKKSEFYCVYAELLENKRLKQIAKNEGYSIVFYPHYAMQSFIECFKEFADDSVIIADREHYDVQQLLMESALLITDYSSVFFDFAYMGKPEIFYQFDEKQYREGHFKKGYFDYYSDAFGKVCKNLNDVIDEVASILGSGCIMSDVYKKRVDNFFTIRDTNNCERIYEEVYRKANSK